MGGQSSFWMKAMFANWTLQCLISPWGQSCVLVRGKPFPKIVPMAKLYSLLACAFIMSTYNNLLLKAKGRKKTCQIAVCNNLLWWNEIIVYHFTIVDLSDAIWQIFVTHFFLLMSLLENATSQWGQAREWVLHKHSCNQFIALVPSALMPSALVLWTVCTCACAKPIPEIVPMVKLDSAG